MACALSAEASDAPPTAYGGAKPGPPPEGPPPAAVTGLVAGAPDTAGACPPLVPIPPAVDTDGAVVVGACVTGEAGMAATGGTGTAETPTNPARPASPANPVAKAAGMANGNRNGAACTNGQNNTIV